MFYGKLKERFENEPGIKGWLMRAGLSSKLASLDYDGSYTHCFYDRLVFSKVKQRLGGNVRILLTGSAPISGEVMGFLKVAFCCPFLEGYGMTETSAGSVTMLVDDPKIGHVGGPVANVKLRLRDIPEMGYVHDDPEKKKLPQGEVCFWGPSIMKGYYKNPEKTAESFDEDGWLKSGDVGEIRPNGSLKIIDRAKNIFKLAQGEYIAPEKLENVYVQSAYVAQNWAYGDSLKEYIISFVVVDPEALAAFAKEKSISEEAAVENEELMMLVYNDLMDLAVKNKFNTLEKPKQLKLLKEPFSVENDMLTPTFKLKRNIARDKFRAEIDALYAKTPLNPKR